MSYFGYEKCGASLHSFVHRKTRGVYADVQGDVPYTNGVDADYHGDTTDFMTLCAWPQIVRDVKTNNIWLDGAMVPPVKAQVKNTPGGKVAEGMEDIPFHGEPLGWVRDQLGTVPASGVRTTTLALTKNQGSGSRFPGTYKGTAHVTVTWKLEDLAS